MALFDLDKLRKNLEQGNRETKADNSKAGGTNVAFFPKGMSIVRLFADSESNFYDSVTLHQAGKNKTECRGRDKCGICQIGYKIREALKEQGREREFQLIPNARKQYKFFMQVIATNVPSDNWVVGETYCGITNGKLGQQLIEYVYDLMNTEAEFVAKMLDPSQPSQVFQINHDRGLQASNNISIHPTKKGEAITPGDWYVPLTEVWKIPDTDESYNLILEEAGRTLNENLGVALPGTSTGDDVPFKAGADSAKKADKADAAPKKDIPIKNADAPACFGQFLRIGDDDRCLKSCPVKDACATRTYAA